MRENFLQSIFGGELMILHVLELEKNKTIKLWNLTDTEAVAQFFDGISKSRKSTTKVRYYNGKAYVNVCGHRYYLDKFTKVEL